MDTDKSPKNKIFSKDNILTLLLGTLAAFFVAKILDPILSFFYSILLNFGGSIVKSISNSTYREISNGVSDQTSSLILYLIFVIICYALSYGSGTIKDKYKALIDSYNDYKKRLSASAKSVTEEENNEVPNMSSERKLEEDIQNISISIDKNLRKNKREYLFMQTLIIFAYIILICAYSKNAFVHEKAVTLTNNIEIVSPYISDLEYKQLKSDFYSMENSDDYNSIMSTLTDIAENNSIKLKK